MKAEKLLHLTLEENGYDEFVTKESGFSQTIAEAMERYAKDYHKSKVKKLNKPAVMPSLPLEVISLLKQVRFTFSNYESGTIGKTMSEDADGLLKQYVGNEA